MTPQELKKALEQAVEAGDFEAAYQIEQELSSLDQGIGLTTGENWATRNIAQPFNQGILNILGILPGGDSLIADSERLGFTASPDSREQGVVPRSMEILGGSSLPLLGLWGKGAQVLKSGIPAAQQTVLQNMASQTAASPKMSAFSELLGAYGAGLGGEAVATETDDQTKQMYGEFAGGLLSALSPILSPAAWAARQTRNMVSNLRSPEYRAAKQIQNNVVDPNKAAQRIDIDSPMPPARQVEEPRMLALEKQARARGSAKDADSIERHIQNTIRDAENAAIDIPGESNIALARIQEQGRKLVDRASAKAMKAADDAEAEIGKLDTGKSVAEMSKSARQKVDDALKAAKDVENTAWSQVGFNSRGSYENTMSAISDILSGVGRSARSDAIPSKVMTELKAAGFTLKKGKWSQSDKPVTTTLRDIHQLRRDVQGLKGAAQLDPEKRQSLAWLNKLDDALLRDMESVSTSNPDALAKARQATLDIYTRFRRGGLGRVLGMSERGTERVVDVDTLQHLVSGKSAARNIEQLIGASPDTRGDALDYYRNMFITKAVRDGGVSKASAQSFIKRLRDNRIFDVLPELETEFLTAATKNDAAQLLAKRAETVGKRGGARYSKSLNKSLADLYSDGVEADVLLNPRTQNPEKLAQRLRGRMEGDPAAEDGLRRSFIEALWKRASSGIDAYGNDKHSAGKLARLLRDNKGTLEQLGFSKEQTDNLERLSTLMRQAQAKPGDVVSDDTVDLTGKVYQIVARIGGAKWGAFVNKVFGGGGAGPSLQSAQVGSSTAREFVDAVRADPAQRIIQDAMDDPALMKSLLLKETATAKEKDAAHKAIHAWAVGVGLADEDDEYGD